MTFKSTAENNEQMTTFIHNTARMVLSNKMGIPLSVGPIVTGQTNNELAIAGINVVADMNERGLTIAESLCTLLAATVELLPALSEAIFIATHHKSSDHATDKEVSNTTAMADEMMRAVMTELLEASMTPTVSEARKRIKEAVKVNTQAQRDAADANQAGV